MAITVYNYIYIMFWPWNIWKITMFNKWLIHKWALFHNYVQLQEGICFFLLTPLTNLKNQNHHENLKTLPEKWFVYNSSQRHNNIYKNNPNTWFMTKPLDESPRYGVFLHFFGDPNGCFHGKSQSKMDALIWSMAISGSDWLEVLSIYKAYLINGLNFREYPHNIWPEKW